MLGIAFVPLSLTPVDFTVGETVRVSVAFSYVVGVNTTVKLCAGPYYTNLLGKHMVDSCVGQADVPLQVSSTPAQGSASVDFTLTPKSQGGIDNGTYGLRVWLEGTDADAFKDNLIIVSGNSSGSDMLTSMLPMIMMLLMMGMIMPMMQQMNPGTEGEQLEESAPVEKKPATDEVAAK